MGLNAEVRDLLRDGRTEALGRLVDASPRALRTLVGRLWDPDAAIRGRAAQAIGDAAVDHPELALEIVRRLMWALNDESATNGVYGIPALAEIGRRLPETIAPFVPALVSMFSDPGLRLELLRALASIAESDPPRIAPELRRLSRFADDLRPDEHRVYLRLVAATEESGDVD